MRHDAPSQDASLAPTLLLAMPQLLDPNFHKSVVLLCQHSADGAFGLVLNRPTGRTAASVIDLDPPPESDSGLTVWTGGPVEPERGCILLGAEPDGVDVVQVRPGVYLSTSPSLLRTLIEGPLPERSRLLVGYAGWGPGQLDGEILQSAWLTADVDLDLVFDVEPAMMWETAIRRLGADPATLHGSPGVH